VTFVKKLRHSRILYTGDFRYDTQLPLTHLSALHDRSAVRTVFFVRIVVIFGELLIILREGAGTVDVRESRASIIAYVPFSWIFLHF
jgi:hypothetical protein